MEIAVGQSVWVIIIHVIAKDLILASFANSVSKKYKTEPVLRF